MALIINKPKPEGYKRQMSQSYLSMTLVRSWSTLDASGKAVRCEVRRDDTTGLTVRRTLPMPHRAGGMDTRRGPHLLSRTTPEALDRS